MYLLLLFCMVHLPTADTIVNWDPVVNSWIRVNQKVVNGPENEKQVNSKMISVESKFVLDSTDPDQLFLQKAKLENDFEDMRLRAAQLEEELKKLKEKDLWEELFSKIEDQLEKFKSLYHESVFKLIGIKQKIFELSKTFISFVSEKHASVDVLEVARSWQFGLISVLVCVILDFFKNGLIIFNPVLAILVFQVIYKYSYNIRNLFQTEIEDGIVELYSIVISFILLYQLQLNTVWLSNKISRAIDVLKSKYENRQYRIISIGIWLSKLATFVFVNFFIQVLLTIKVKEYLATLWTMSWSFPMSDTMLLVLNVFVLVFGLSVACGNYINRLSKNGIKLLKKITLFVLYAKLAMYIIIFLNSVYFCATAVNLGVLAWFGILFFCFLTAWAIYMILVALVSYTMIVLVTTFDVTDFERSAKELKTLCLIIAELFKIYFCKVSQKILFFCFGIPMFVAVLFYVYNIYYIVLFIYVIFFSLHIWCLCHLDESNVQVSRQRYGLQKKHYLVRVCLGGIKPELLSKINDSIANSWSDMVKSYAILAEKLNHEKEIKTRELDQLKNKLKNDFTIKLQECQTEIGKINASINADTAKQIVETRVKTFLTEINRRLQIDLAKARSLCDYHYGGAEVHAAFDHANNVLNVGQHINRLFDNINAYIIDAMNVPNSEGLNLILQTLDNLQVRPNEEFVRINQETTFTEGPHSDFDQSREISPTLLSTLPENGRNNLATWMVSKPIEAFSEIEAAQEFDHEIKTKLNDNQQYLRFRGQISEWSENVGEGIWQYKIISNIQDTIVIRDGLIKPWIFKLHLYLKTAFMGMFNELANFVLGNLIDENNNSSDRLIRLLCKSDLYSDLNLIQIRDALFCQGESLITREGADLLHSVRHIIEPEILDGNKKKKNNLKEIYFQYLNFNTDKVKKFNQELKSKHVLLDFDYALQGMKLPKKLPSGLCLVVYAGSPYLIKESYMHRFGLVKQQLVPVKEKSMCLYNSLRRNQYFKGHVTSQCCSKCGADFVGICDYGYADLYSELGLMICNEVKFIDKPAKRCEMGADSHNIPIDSMFGVISNDTVVGNAFMATHQGFRKLLVPTHVIAYRMDGRDLPPGKWATDSLNKKDLTLKKKLAESSGSEVFEFGNFYVIKDIILELPNGKRFKTNVKKLFGEVSLLNITEEMDDIPGIMVARTDYNSFNPSVLYAMQQIGVRHAITAEPIITIITEDKKKLDYHTGGGFSGAPMLQAGLVCAMHLGGTNSGKGMAYAKINVVNGDWEFEIQRVGICEECHGVHMGICLSQRVTDDEGLFDFKGWKSNLKGKGNQKQVMLKLHGDNIICEIYDSTQNAPLYKTYKIKSFIDSGIDELYDSKIPVKVIVTDGIREIADDILLSSKNLDDLKFKLTEHVDSIVPQIAPISQDLYLECAKKIGENRLQELMSKSLSELETHASQLIDQNVGLREKREEIESTIKNMQQDYRYQESLKTYRQDLAEFMQKKRDLMEVQEYQKALKKKYKSEREAMQNELSAQIAQLQRNKEKVIEGIEALKTSLTLKLKDVLDLIATMDSRIKIMKTEGESPMEKEIRETITKCDQELVQLNKLRKQLIDQYRVRFSHTQEVINELKKIKEEKMDLYKSIKEQIKNCNLNITNVNQQAQKEIKELRKDFESKLPTPPVTNVEIPQKPVQPKFKNLDDLSNIKNDLTKALKKNNIYKSVLDKLILKEKEHLKSLDLSKLIEHTKSTSTQCNLENVDEVKNQMIDLIDYYSILSDLVDPDIEGVLVIASLKYFLSKSVNMALSDLIDSYYYNNYFCPDCFDAIIEVLESARDRIFTKIGLNDMGDREREFFVRISETFADYESGEYDDDVQNQVLKPVYFNLTPTIANSSVFQQNCLAPQCPAVISCSQCERVFQCDMSHIQAATGKLSDLGCTLECLRNQNQLFRDHLGDCMKKPQLMSINQSKFGGVHFVCNHPSEDYASKVDQCPTHFGLTVCCAAGRSRNDYTTIVLQNMEQYISPSCAVGILYMMASCPGAGQCQRKPSEKDKTMVDQMQRQAGKYQGPFLLIKDQRYSLYGLPMVVQAKMISLASEYNLGQIVDESIVSQSLVVDEDHNRCNEIIAHVNDLTSEIDLLKKQVQDLLNVIGNVPKESNDKGVINEIPAKEQVQSEDEIFNQCYELMTNRDFIKKMSEKGRSDEVIQIQKAIDDVNKELTISEDMSDNDLIDLCRERSVNFRFFNSLNDKKIALALVEHELLDTSLNLDPERLYQVFQDDVNGQTSLGDLIRQQVKRELAKKNKTYFKTKKQVTQKKQVKTKPKEENFLGQDAASQKVLT